MSTTEHQTPELQRLREDVAEVMPDLLQKHRTETFRRRLARMERKLWQNVVGKREVTRR